jgi:hypothetical protein
MNKKLLKGLFPIIAILLLTPWPIAYAYDSGTSGQETILIQAAESSAAPSMVVFGKAISGIESGDLFYIDTTNNAADIQVTLYITNTEELINNYRYIILKIGVYAQGDDGDWEKASGNNGEPIPDTFITMLNGQVSFTLAGYSNYKLTIDSGSVNCITANTEEGSISPQFFLEVD